MIRSNENSRFRLKSLNAAIADLEHVWTSYNQTYNSADAKTKQILQTFDPDGLKKLCPNCDNPRIPQPEYHHQALLKLLITRVGRAADDCATTLQVSLGHL